MGSVAGDGQNTNPDASGRSLPDLPSDSAALESCDKSSV